MGSKVVIQVNGHASANARVAFYTTSATQGVWDPVSLSADGWAVVDLSTNPSATAPTSTALRGSPLPAGKYTVVVSPSEGESTAAGDWSPVWAAGVVHWDGSNIIEPNHNWEDAFLNWGLFWARGAKKVHIDAVDNDYDVLTLASGYSLEVNAFQNAACVIMDGNLKGEVKKVSSNTASAINLSSALSGDPLTGLDADDAAAGECEVLLIGRIE